MADDPRIEAARLRVARIDTRSAQLESRRENLVRLVADLADLDSRIASGAEQRTALAGRVAQADTRVTEALLALERALLDQPDPG